jgi:rhomboid protease GluP
MNEPSDSQTTQPPTEFDPLDGFEAQDRFEPSTLKSGFNPIQVKTTASLALPFYKRNPITTTLALVLIIVYGCTSFSNHFQFPSKLAVALGVFYGPAVQDGQWWRYLTATLLHDNPGHLLNNTVGILIFGNLLEPILGRLYLASLYGVAMIVGLSLVLLFQPNTPVLGASTINYGLIGAYLTLVLLIRYQIDRSTFLKEFRGAFLFVAMFILWNWMESTKVSLWGHVGGLIGGILFGLVVWTNRSSLKQQSYDHQSAKPVSTSGQRDNS